MTQQEIETPIDHAARQHSEMSGSGADRTTNCTGSVFLYRQLPKSVLAVTNPRAIFGTATHELSEKALRSFLQKKITGEGIPGVAELVMNEPDDEKVNGALRYCELIWDKVLYSYLTGKAYGIEETFILNKKYDMWGTADFWCIYKDDRARRVLCIVDLKMGYHEVNIKSLQFPYYACSVREEILEAGKDIDYVRCVVIQPPLGSDINEATGLPRDYKEIQYSAKQLDAIKKKFMKSGYQVYEKQKPIFKTGTWCTHCKGQPLCKKYQQELGAGSGLGPVHDIVLPEVSTLSTDQLVKIVSMRKPLTAFLKACSSYALQLYANGTPLPGVKVVQAVAKRKWLSDEASVVQGLVDLGLDEEKLYAKKLIGLGKVKTLLKEDAGYRVKDADEAITPFTVKPQGALSIVPLEDDRPAIEKVGDLLTAVSEDEMEED